MKKNIKKNFLAFIFGIFSYFIIFNNINIDNDYVNLDDNNINILDSLNEELNDNDKYDVFEIIGETLMETGEIVSIITITDDTSNMCF